MQALYRTDRRIWHPFAYSFRNERNEPAPWKCRIVGKTGHCQHSVFCSLGNSIHRYCLLAAFRCHCGRRAPTHGLRRSCLHDHHHARFHDHFRGRLRDGR